MLSGYRCNSIYDMFTIQFILGEQVWFPHMEPVPSWWVLIKQKLIYKSLRKKNVLISVSIWASLSASTQHENWSVIIVLKRLHQTLNTFEMLPADIWTEAVVLEPSHMDTPGCTRSDKMMGLWESVKESARPCCTVWKITFPESWKSQVDRSIIALRPSGWQHKHMIWGQTEKEGNDQELQREVEGRNLFESNYRGERKQEIDYWPDWTNNLLWKGHL